MPRQRAPLMPRFVSPIFLLPVLLCFYAIQSHATMTVSYGSDTIHTHSVTKGGTKLTLNPDPISNAAQFFLRDDPSISFQNAMTSSNAAADWFGDTVVTFNYTGDLHGNLTVDVYNAAFKTEPKNGGAQLLVHYNLGPLDPAAADLFWIQVVSTSRPNGGETIPYPDVYFSGYAPGAKLPFYFRPDETVLDGNPYTNPARPNIHSGAYTYGPGNVAVNYDVSFWDWPSRYAPANWEGELFLATYDEGAKFVKIYDGIVWGFAIPVPNTLYLLMATALSVVVSRHRWRSGWPS